MPRTITLSVDGSNSTVHKISMYDMKLKQEVMDLVKSTSKTIQQTAKSNAPVSRVPKSKGKNGDLKRSIRPKYFDNGLSSTVVPRKPKGAHRHLVEYGSSPRRTKSGAYRGVMPAQPFMAPAENASDGQYNQQMRRIIERDQII